MPFELEFHPPLQHEVHLEAEVTSGGVTVAVEAGGFGPRFPRSDSLDALSAGEAGRSGDGLSFTQWLMEAQLVATPVTSPSSPAKSVSLLTLVEPAARSVECEPATAGAGGMVTSGMLDLSLDGSDGGERDGTRSAPFQAHDARYAGGGANSGSMSDAEVRAAMEAAMIASQATKTDGKGNKGQTHAAARARRPQPLSGGHLSPQPRSPSASTVRTTSTSPGPANRSLSS